MNFNTASISFHSRMTAACRQYSINENAPVKMHVSGPSRYTDFRLDDNQTKTVNELAKSVGIEHENGEERNQFMVYGVNFRPGKVVAGSREASTDEKKVFQQIFQIAVELLSTQMGHMVSSEDVKRINIEKTVDFSMMKTCRACNLVIVLSQSASDRLKLESDTRFLEYRIDSPGVVMTPIYPGQ